MRLRAALDSFEALAFPGLTESARQELRASGVTPPRRAPEAWAQLTPQELQIAQMAAAGDTRRARITRPENDVVPRRARPRRHPHAMVAHAATILGWLLSSIFVLSFANLARSV